MNLNQILLIDIETVPQQPNFNELSTDWKNLWIEKASRYYNQQEPTPPESSYQERAGILAEFGKIICICVGLLIDEGNNKPLKLKVKKIYGHNEKDLLTAFVNICDRFQLSRKRFYFAGHNIKEFDVPYLCRRMLINGLHLPKYLQLHAQKPWDNAMVDTLVWWRFGDYKNYISLNLLTAALGIPSPKTGIDGKMVRAQYYEHQNLEGIAQYCAQDVIAVANIVLKFLDHSLLDPNNIEIE
jgi:3'-5' exonuclease